MSKNISLVFIITAIVLIVVGFVSSGEKWNARKTFMQNLSEAKITIIEPEKIEIPEIIDDVGANGFSPKKYLADLGYKKYEYRGGFVIKFTYIVLMSSILIGIGVYFRYKEDGNNTKNKNTNSIAENTNKLDHIKSMNVKSPAASSGNICYGLKWFYFYILAYVPISLLGSLGYVSAKKQALVDLGYTREMIDVIYKGYDSYQYVIYAFTVFAIVVVCGLYFRKLWAWNCNWILLTFLVISYDPSSKMESMIYIVIFKIIFIFIPNYLYWMKRKPMFS